MAAKSKPEQQSLLQDQAKKLRQLKLSIDDYEKVEMDLVAELDQAEIRVMQLRSNLVDTRALLAAQRTKLLNDANDMHNLIEKATTPARRSVHGEPFS